MRGTRTCKRILIWDSHIILHPGALLTDVGVRPIDVGLTTTDVGPGAHNVAENR